MSHKRVVVTGLGLVSPLGLNVKENWSNIISSKTNFTKLVADGVKIFYIQFNY
jgi:3-oxoacyl-[acyl-carrier-protein] synthase II